MDSRHSLRVIVVNESVVNETHLSVALDCKQREIVERVRRLGFRPELGVEDPNR